MGLALRLAIEAVPAAGGVVAALVAVAVAVVVATVDVIVGVALEPGGITVAAIKQALLAVAGLVAEAILEHVPAGFTSRGRVAELPGVDAQAAVPAVVVAGVGVALLVAPVVARLGLAQVVLALLPLGINVDNLVAAVGLVDAPGAGLVLDVAIFASPSSLAGAVVVPDSVDALAVILARIIGALIPGVLFTSLARCSSWTNASKLGSVTTVDASSTIATRRAIATCSGKLAIGSDESWWARAVMRAILVGANSAILTRIALAKVAFGLAVATHPAVFTNTVVVVHELDAFLCAKGRAWVRQTLIDVSFASWSNISSRTFAVIAT